MPGSGFRGHLPILFLVFDVPRRAGDLLLGRRRLAASHRGPRGSKARKHAAGLVRPSRRLARSISYVDVWHDAPVIDKIAKRDPTGQKVPGRPKRPGEDGGSAAPGLLRSRILCVPLSDSSHNGPIDRRLHCNHTKIGCGHGWIQEALEGARTAKGDGRITRSAAPPFAPRPRGLGAGASRATLHRLRPLPRPPPPNKKAPAKKAKGSKGAKGNDGTLSAGLKDRKAAATVMSLVTSLGRLQWSIYAARRAAAIASPSASRL